MDVISSLPERRRCLSRALSAAVLLVSLVLAGCLVACVEPSERAAAETTITSAEAFARRVLEVVEDRRIDDLARLVHPTRGLLFSPYGYIERDSAAVLSPDALQTAWRRNARLRFGVEDGTGEPLDLRIHDYFSRWLYAANYAEAPRVATNRVIGQGNSINNLWTVFPDAAFVEFHFPGFNPAYGGMDWLSLRVVLSQRPDGGWWLVGLVNDRWTI